MTGLSVFVFSLVLLLGLLVASVCVLWQPSYQNDKYKPVWACLTVAATGSASRQSGYVKVVNWNAEPLLTKSLFLPSYSTIDNSLIGWAVPISGTYFVAYETWCAFQNATFVQSSLIVNGDLVLRSVGPNVCSTNNTGTTATVSLNKSFLLNLEKGDVISLVVGASSPNVTIPTSNDSGYATTLTLDLRIPFPCQSKDSQVDYSGNTGPYVVGPLMTEDLGAFQPVNHLLHPTDQWCNRLFSLEQASQTLQASGFSTKDYQQFSSHFNRKENVSLPPTQTLF